MSRIAVLSVVVVVWVYFADTWTSLFLSSDSGYAFRLYALVIMTDGMAEFVRGGVFGPLFLQRHQQASQVTKSALLLVGLIVAGDGVWGAIALDDVILVESAASFGGLVVCIAFVVGVLVRYRPRDNEASVERPLALRRMLRFAADQYANDLLRLAGGASTVTVLGAQLLPVSSIAIFGFARNLAEQIKRFLPAELFAGLFRAKIAADYAKDGRFELVRRRTLLILKLSNVPLLLCAAIVIVYGKEVASVISGGTYSGAGWVIAAFIGWLVIHSQRVAVVTVATTVERVDVLRRASVLFAMTTVPVAALLASVGAEAYGLILGLTLGECVYIAAATVGLKRAGFDLQSGLWDYAPSIGAWAAAIGVGLFVPTLEVRLLERIALGAGTMSLAFFTALWLLKPLTGSEWQAVTRLVGGVRPQGQPRHVR